MCRTNWFCNLSKFLNIDQSKVLLVKNHDFFMTC